MMVIDVLNAIVGCENTLPAHVVREPRFRDRNNEGEKFIDFCSCCRLVIGGTLFKFKAFHKVSWVSPDRQRTSN